MPRRRSISPAPPQPHWLTVSDNSRQLFVCYQLPIGTDPLQALRAEAAKWISAGWQIDGDVTYGFCFIQHGDERRLIKLCRSDPAIAFHGGHAFLAGAGSVHSSPD